MFKFSSQFSYTGDATATLNSLTNVHNAAPVNLSVSIDTLLSTDNYPSPAVANVDAPNAANQLVFMAQPMSWWLSGLASEKIKYAPVSNHVNWAYTTASGAVVHIGMPISNLLIPNRNQSSTRDASSNVMTLVFEPKLGMGRTDTSEMHMPLGAGATGPSA